MIKWSVTGAVIQYHTGEKDGDVCKYCGYIITFMGGCMIGCKGYYERVDTDYD